MEAEEIITGNNTTKAFPSSSARFSSVNLSGAPIAVPNWNSDSQYLYRPPHTWFNAKSTVIPIWNPQLGEDSSSSEEKKFKSHSFTFPLGRSDRLDLQKRLRSASYLSTGRELDWPWYNQQLLAESNQTMCIPVYGKHRIPLFGRPYPSSNKTFLENQLLLLPSRSGIFTPIRDNYPNNSMHNIRPSSEFHHKITASSGISPPSVTQSISLQRRKHIRRPKRAASDPAQPLPLPPHSQSSSSRLLNNSRQHLETAEQTRRAFSVDWGVSATPAARPKLTIVIPSRKPKHSTIQANKSSALGSEKPSSNTKTAHSVPRSHDPARVRRPVYRDTVYLDWKLLGVILGVDGEMMVTPDAHSSIHEKSWEKGKAVCRS